jgi:hypothetical protein
MVKMLKIELYVIPINDMVDYDNETLVNTYLKEGRVNDLLLHFGEVQEADIGEYGDNHKLNQKGVSIYKFRGYFEPPDMVIRRVGILGGRLKQQALDMGCNEKDIVLVTTTIPEGGGLPVFKVEKIEGSPVEWLQKKFLDG